MLLSMALGTTRAHMGVWNVPPGMPPLIPDATMALTQADTLEKRGREKRSREKRRVGRGEGSTKGEKEGKEPKGKKEELQQETSEAGG